jgi:hypothetical protein
MASEFQVTITRSSRRSIALHVLPNGMLEVRAPNRMPQLLIDRFLGQHEDWIEKSLAKVALQLKNKRADDQYLYVGKTVTLKPGNFTEIKVVGETLQFPQSLLFRKDKELTAWYIKEATRVITAQTDKYAIEMKTGYKEITFSDTKSQWGRCTRDNRLQFSWRLIMAPLLTLNYVVIHELAHTLEKNHTQLFWMKVRNINPSYRQQIKWLKDHGSSLKI